jgi:hypothetical protein
MLEINPYSLEINQRRRLLADAGFARNDQRIWIHPDGRAVGEAVIAALTDAAFCRLLQIEAPLATHQLEIE